MTNTKNWFVKRQKGIVNVELDVVEKPIEVKAKAPEKKKPIYLKEIDKKKMIVPCENCPYLQNNRVCAYVRCVMIQGWKGDR